MAGVVFLGTCEVPKDEAPTFRIEFWFDADGGVRTAVVGPKSILRDPDVHEVLEAAVSAALEGLRQPATAEVVN